VRILFLTPWYPWPASASGAHQRIHHLAVGLARRHRVTLVAPIFDATEPDQSDPLVTLCECVIRVSERSTTATPRIEGSPIIALLKGVCRYVSSALLPPSARSWEGSSLGNLLRALQASQRYDLVWAERIWMAEAARRAGFRRNVLVDMDDVESVTIARWLRYCGDTISPLARAIAHAERRRASAYERTVTRRFSCSVVCKESDRSLVGRDPSRVFVLPNRADEHPPLTARDEDSRSVLFIGNFRHFPNVDAIEHFCRDILPALRQRCPDVRFTVVGGGIPTQLTERYNRAGCVFTGAVPDLRPFYASAAVVVVPMRLGSGTRLKTLEALSFGKAVVSTSVGAEGLDLRPSVDLEIADDPLAFAEVCGRLLGDDNARRRLGEAGHERVLARYRWEAIYQRTEQLLSLLSNGS
jgi:glycosyltransferase involved in cell wall biosynthesis